MKTKSPLHVSLLFCALCFLILSTSAQVLYTARGYWEESTKKTYRQLKLKQQASDSLSTEEQNYIQDYEVYLNNYFNRLPPEEKKKYEEMKPTWDLELVNGKPASSAEVKEFEWRNRDRFINALYGVYYGATIVSIAEIDNAAAAGIPLITGGMWLLGPALNPKKYEGITEGTIRMSNTGKLLGLINGFALGYAIGGDSENANKLALGLSTVGSIAAGEIAFQRHKKYNYSDGYTEMLRHYGILGPWVALSGMAAANVDNTNLLGLSVLVGSAGGLLIGNKVAKRYDYTRGDADAVSSLSVICTGLGFAFVTEAYKNNDASGLILIPAAGSVLGTIWGQQSVKGVSLTKKQGSTINLSTAGAALVGLGVVALTESESAGVWIGVPSGLALITHQLLMQHFRKKNLDARFEGRKSGKDGLHVSMNFTPENILLNRKISAPDFNYLDATSRYQSVVSLKMKF